MNKLNRANEVGCYQSCHVSHLQTVQRIASFVFATTASFIQIHFCDGTQCLEIDGRDRPGLIKVSLVDKVIARVMTSLELIHSIRPVQFSNIHEALQALFHIARPLPRHYRLFFVDQLRLQYLSRNYRL